MSAFSWEWIRCRFCGRWMHPKAKTCGNYCHWDELVKQQTNQGGQRHDA